MINGKEQGLVIYWPGSFLAHDDIDGGGYVNGFGTYIYIIKKYVYVYHVIIGLINIHLECMLRYIF